MKKSFGSVPKTRLKRILEALLVFSNEGRRGPLHLKCSQKLTVRLGQQPNQIYIRTSVETIADLTNEYEMLQGKVINDPLVSWQVAEVLKHLETTLGILIDCRRKRQGATERYFKLELWHPISEVILNLTEVNHRWPKTLKLVAEHSLEISQNPFIKNIQLLRLIQTAERPITWQQFAKVTGLSDINEQQSKVLLAETCKILLENPPQVWINYLYRFSPHHLIEGESSSYLLSAMFKILPLQRSTINLIVEQILSERRWFTGEINSFVLQLVHSDNWLALQSLTEIIWKVVDAEEFQMASQIMQLIADEMPYKYQIKKILDIKQKIISSEYTLTILEAGIILKNKGIHPSIKYKVTYLLVQALVSANRCNLAWKICKRILKEISPETDLEDWLRFQCIICCLDIHCNRESSAQARLLGLEKIIDSQNVIYIIPMVIELKGEYYEIIKEYNLAQSSFELSLEKYEKLKLFNKAQKIREKLLKISEKIKLPYS